MGRVYYRRNQHTVLDAAMELLGQALADEITAGDIIG